MGACFLYGNISQVTSGDDGFKARIFDGTSPPSSPKDNDIWINTSIAINGWELSDKALPIGWAMGTGFVYIKGDFGGSYDYRNTTGLNLAIPGNHNGTVYARLTSCVQYNGSTWENKDAWIWHGSQWYQFSSAWDGHLFNYGDTYSSITGGWVARDIAHTTDQYGPYNAAPSVQAQSNGGVKVYMSNTGKSGIWTTANKVSLAGFSTLTFNGNLYDSHGWNRAQLDIWSDFGTYSSENVVARLNATYNAGTYTLDISSLTGSYYIGVRTDFDGYAIVNEIKLS